MQGWQKKQAPSEKAEQFMLDSIPTLEADLQLKGGHLGMLTKYWF